MVSNIFWFSNVKLEDTNSRVSFSDKLSIQPKKNRLTSTSLTSHFQDNTFNWHEYHGQQRVDDINLLSRYDIVLTTYDTLVANCSARRKKVTSNLSAVKWHRIVLDEGKLSNSEALDIGRWLICYSPSHQRTNDTAL